METYQSTKLDIPTIKAYEETEEDVYEIYKEIENSIKEEIEQKKSELNDQLQQLLASDADAESKEQYKKVITNKQQDLEDNVHKNYCKLYRKAHAKYALYSLGKQKLPSFFENQKTWIMYWLINTITMLDQKDFRQEEDQVLKFEIIEFLKYFQKSDGGFAGAVKYATHHATTYAAVQAIGLLDCKEAYDIIDREAMKNYLLRTRHKSIKGCVHIQEDGEIDLRANYIMLFVASLQNIQDDDLTDGVAEYIAQCQTYEGGLAPFPYAEAHAGYTYCGLAALAIQGKIDQINTMKLLEWLINKQCDLEGGFKGRTNKVVDSCYSFWVGACFSILNDYNKDKNQQFIYNYEGSLQFNQEALQKYVLWACQDLQGGLVDKPGKNVDYYHMNYSLSGFNLSLGCNTGKDYVYTFFGDCDENEMVKIDSVYAFPIEKMNRIKAYFLSKDKI